MRQLPVDFKRAVEIHRRCEDEGELLRASAERVRAAKRRVQEAEAQIERAADEPFAIDAHQRSDRKAPFHPGLAAHNLRNEELNDARSALATANARYHAMTAEVSYWRGLNAQIIAYLRSKFSDRQLPLELRASEEN